MKEIYTVKLSSQQLPKIPVDLLAIAAAREELPGLGYHLSYRDRLTAYKAAAASGGTVVRNSLGR